jgi:tryptophan-rich sensory protein
MQNMKKSSVITGILLLVLTTGVFGGFIANLIIQDKAGVYQGAIALPGLFPSQTLMIILQFVILACLGLAFFIISKNTVNVNRRKNVLINSFIFLGLIYSWNYMLFSAGNITGALVLSIAGLVLGLIDLVMAALVDQRAGGLFIPANLWMIFLIILSIFLKVQN